MDSSLQKAIDHASVVSFDVFDTLIKRNCANPTDIFTITEKRFNRQNGDKITGFKKARIEEEITTFPEENINPKITLYFLRHSYSISIRE